MSDMLGLAMSGVRAYRATLDTIADNVANAATPGYVRRTVALGAATPPSAMGPLNRDPIQGAGVEIRGIVRAIDLLRQDSLRRAEGEVLMLSTAERWLTTTQNSLTGPSTLARPMSEMFASLADLAADPSSLPARGAFLAKADTLAQRFNASAAGLAAIGRDIDLEAEVEAQTLTGLARGLAAVNGQLRRATEGGAAAAVLADERDKILQQMAGIASIEVRLGPDGQAEVRIPDRAGPAIVNGVSSEPARAVPQAGGGYQLEIGQSGSAERTAVISGALAGLSAAKRQLDQLAIRLDELADRLAEAMNRVHQGGADLDGAPGGPLFATVKVEVVAAAGNGGSARVSASLADGATAEPMRLSFDRSTGEWTLALADGTDSVTGPMPLALGGVEVSAVGRPSGGDVWRLEPRAGAAGLALRPLGPRELAASAPYFVEPAAANEGSVMARLGPGPSLDPPGIPPFSAVLNALGLWELSDADGVVLAVGAPGDPIAGDGFTLTFDGAGVEGDRFVVRPAPPGTANGGVAQALAALAGLDGGAGSFGEQHDGLVSSISVPLSEIRVRLDVARGARDAAAEAMDQASGVDLNTEAAEMLRFQQAYQANARLIQTAREIFQTLLDAAR